MRRVTTRRSLTGPVGVGVVGRGGVVGRDEIECRREIVAAPAPSRFGIGDAIEI